MPARKSSRSATPRTTKRATKAKQEKAPLDADTLERKRAYLAMRAELRKQPRVSHKEQVARFHARVAEDRERARAAAETAAAAAVEQERIRQETEARDALEAKYAANPLLRPIPPAGQTLGAVRMTIKRHVDPIRAAGMRRYLQAEPGGYGEGDRFLGLPVPTSRAIAKQFRSMRLPFVVRLLRSKYHEERLIALLILSDQYMRGSTDERRLIVETYLRHRQYVNNWDLVDTSAPFILGPDAYEHRASRALLEKLVQSPSVWDRRIAIMSTSYFIRCDRFGETLKLARRLLHDPHDLIHKAVGWMLREIGKRDRARLYAFLDRYHATMPRVMLRYAIEHLTPSQRRRYMAA